MKTQKDGTPTYHAYDIGGNLLHDQRDSRFNDYIFVFGKHFARVDGRLDDTNERKIFYHTDHLGSTVAVTDVNGNKLWEGDYTPFGQRILSTEDKEDFARFTGKDYDEDTGLYYFNARWYDSELGRFVIEDPAADPNNPNLYVYCANNPLRYLDPTGKTLEGSDDFERNKQLTEYMSRKYNEYTKLASYSNEKKAQYYLSKMGFDTGGVDGVMGVKSSSALIIFQYSQGLPITGEVDDATLAQFEKCVRKTSYESIMYKMRDWNPEKSTVDPNEKKWRVKRS